MEQLNYRQILDQKFKSYKSDAKIFKEYKIYNDKLVIDFTSHKIIMTFYKNGITRIFLGEIGENQKETGAVIYDDIKTNLDIKKNNKYIIVLNEKYDIFINIFTTEIDFYDKQGDIICRDFQPSFIDEDGNIFISKENDAYAYYGLGEKGGELNKKGTYTENYNTDDYETDDNSNMYYKTIPFYIAKKDNKTYGIFFDNSFRSYFDMGKEYKDRIFFGANGGQINYYFIYGENIKEVTKNYATLTGKMEMPPLWSLGYQQCRFSYLTTKEVESVISKFEKKQIPIDVIYLDIDYMDGFKIMTFKEKEFENIDKTIINLKNKGIKTITILDPGVKIDDEYSIYKNGKNGEHFTKTLDGQIYVGAVWAGDSAFPDFSNKECRKWWKDELKLFIDKYKIDGIWNDMNEPCVFNNDFKTMPENALHNSDYGVIEHKEFHNRYGFEMSRASFEAQKELNPNERGFSMTRATYAGGQRFSSIWTGDNSSLFSQLRMSICMNINLGISGFSFVGNDVAGFGLDANEELFIRWNEVGAFLPILRNHSNMHTRRQEPWEFGKRAEDIAKKYIKLRYELMPYLYNAYYVSHIEGLPIFRGMIMEFDDINLINNKEQFMFGQDILVAPVLYEKERRKVVYLPKGIWYNYFTNEKFEINSKNGKTFILRCELDEILVFVKDGSIIPTYKEDYMNMQNRPSTVTFKVYGENAKTIYYYDDGKTYDYKNDKYNLGEIKCTKGKLNISHIKQELPSEQFDFEYIN